MTVTSEHQVKSGGTFRVRGLEMDIVFTSACIEVFDRSTGLRATLLLPSRGAQEALPDLLGNAVELLKSHRDTRSRSGGKGKR